ncbi:hypothetical protein EW145_g3848 [Phellinidium pouzarii]|uniref:Cytochrome P450 n=1 Tax=Phellinidium pouzarii TaxID=167371 RepID=A0A4S4L641_9AGAM|nr:hypothetical protein EW145_g3848 [Phellinidium pouzarii]
MDISLTETLTAFLLAYTLWRAYAFVVNSPLSNIPGPPAESWWKGSYGQIFNKNGWAFHRELRENYGSVSRIKGLFGNDHLYVWDPLALYNIFVKDQYIFEGRPANILTNRITLGTSLLSSLGDEHRKQRKMLNPVFSSKHMRGMLPMLYPIAHQLREAIANDIRNNEEHIDIMGWVSRSSLEYIGQGGLGYSFSSFDVSKKANSYSEALKMFVPLLFRLQIVRQQIPWLVKIGSPKFRERVMDFIPFDSVRDIRRITKTMEESSRSILRGKREAIEKGDKATLAQVGSGKDIMSVLLKANADTNLSDEDLLGHMSTFVLAAHDTTTSAVSRILHVLAANPDSQSKLREEVTAARKEHGDLDYDTLQALPYLDAVCRETLRVYSPVPLVDRVATQDIVLPLKWPIKAIDGKTEIKEIHVPKNTNLLISITAANLCKSIWGDDAEVWKPERWLKPLPESVADAHLPGVYSQILWIIYYFRMTFIGGSRACIGFKFSEMEMKMVLSILLESFIFEPVSDVIWEFGLIHVPAAKGTKDGMPRLPMKVSLVKS